jgi:serine/threonine-protein kinase
MDSSPVDEAWETGGADASASDPPPASEDHRTPVQVVADLRHPHLIVMRRSDEGDAFEPELAGGMSLAELSRSEAGWFPLPLRVGLRILLDAMSGLAAIHQATKNGQAIDFVHGEVAPSNIIVGRDGVGRLVPVLPAHWNDGEKPNPDVTGYIAPERLLGDVFGQPADVFSAGVLLWEAITGKPLFRNWPLEAIVTQLIGRKVPYPIPIGDALWGVPLADVAMRALAVDPIERWANVGALGAQVENIARAHLASSDEIAALIAGFAAGRGHGSVAPVPEVAPPPLSAPNMVTSLSPTASSIQSPPESQAVQPVEVPAAELAPPAARWETVPPPPPRIWVPGEAKQATQRSAVSPSSAEVADSWSGLAPWPGSLTSKRTKILVWTAVSVSFAITGMVAYRVLNRSPEASTTATVLAPKAATPGQPSAAHGTETPKGQSGAPSTMPAPAGSEPSAASAENPSGTNVPTVPSSIAGSAPTAVSAPPAMNRPARPATRSAPTPRAAPTLPPAVTAAPPAPIPTPPPAAKPKPKEDLFGI